MDDEAGMGAASPRDEARSTATPVPAAATLPHGAADPPHWGGLHDAWQHAMQTRDAWPGKEPLPARVVIAIAEHRLRASRALREALEHDPSLGQRIDALRAHARDAQGRNWNVAVPACDTTLRAGYEADFLRVVDALRDQFDLA
jgi:hypothetical protein